MKRKIVLAAIAAAVLSIDTQVFAQEKIGTMDDTPMWSVPNSVQIESSVHTVDSLMHVLKAKSKATKINGAYYGSIDDGARYRSAECEVTWPNNDHPRVYIENQQVMCTVDITGDGSVRQTYAEVSTQDKDALYRSSGKSRPFFFGKYTPDIGFFNKGLAALEKTLQAELKKYN